MGPESLGTPPWNSEQAGPITKPQGRAAQASTTSHLLARAAWSRHAECWVDGSARVGEGRRGHASDATRGTPTSVQPLLHRFQAWLGNWAYVYLLPTSRPHV